MDSGGFCNVDSGGFCDIDSSGFCDVDSSGFQDMDSGGFWDVDSGGFWVVDSGDVDVGQGWNANWWLSLCGSVLHFPCCLCSLWNGMSWVSIVLKIVISLTLCTCWD